MFILFIHVYTFYTFNKVEDFYAAYPDAGTGERAREESLDSIRNNIAWRDRSEDEVTQWLQRFQ